MGKGKIEDGREKRCWCGELIDAPGHPIYHTPERRMTAKGTCREDERRKEFRIRTDSRVIIECERGERREEGQRKPETPSADKPEKPPAHKGSGRTLEPPKNLPRDPWEIIQTMRRICQGGTPPPRKDSFLPYLVIRANPGDRGQRPVPNGIPTWESPDIFVMPNQASAGAPNVPADLGGMAEAGVPNTVYAHVWNLGRAPAFDVRVEFYWFNPTLGIEGSDANLIGFTYVTLGARTGQNSHAVVRCPADWVPRFVNGGHECLVVRAFSPISDPLGQNAWNSTSNRHVGQRNIKVVHGTQEVTDTLVLTLAPGHSVHDAHLVAVNVNPNEVPWMQLLLGKRKLALTRPSLTPIFGLTVPSVALEMNSQHMDLRVLSKDALSHVLSQNIHFKHSVEPLQVTFAMRHEELEPNQAQVIRVQQLHENQVVGGYTTIVLP